MLENRILALCLRLVNVDFATSTGFRRRLAQRIETVKALVNFGGCLALSSLAEIAEQALEEDFKVDLLLELLGNDFGVFIQVILLLDH